MKKNIIASVICLLSFHGFSQSFTPNVVGSSGTFTAFVSGSMSWTIGELMTETYSSSNNYFTQGFHQPDTSFVIAVENYFSQRIFIFPNPVVHNLTIDFSMAGGAYLVKIFNTHGKVLRSEFIPSNQKLVNITFREWANGMYLLNIINVEPASLASYTCKIYKSE